MVQLGSLYALAPRLHRSPKGLSQRLDDIKIRYHTGYAEFYVARPEKALAYYHHL